MTDGKIDSELDVLVQMGLIQMTLVDGFTPVYSLTSDGQKVAEEIEQEPLTEDDERELDKFIASLDDAWEKMGF